MLGWAEAGNAKHLQQNSMLSQLPTTKKLKTVRTLFQVFLGFKIPNMFDMLDLAKPAQPGCKHQIHLEEHD